MGHLAAATRSRNKCAVLVALALVVVLAFGAAAGASTTGYPAGSTVLQCTNGAGDVLVPRVRPYECFLDYGGQGVFLPLAGAAHLHRIHWNGWGGPTARATAVLRVKTNEPWTRVRVMAFRRVGDGDLYFYNRVRLTFPGGRSHVWRTADP